MKTNTIPHSLCIGLPVVLLVLAWAPRAWCQGKLDAFKADAKAPSLNSGNAGRSGGHDHDHGGGFGEFLIEMAGMSILYGGVSSWDRVSDAMHMDTEVEPRLLGEPLIPFARCDVAYQNVHDEIRALDMRAEAGYGPFGVHFDNTHYDEKNPADSLDVTRILGLYRMSFGSYVETDLGFGSLTLNGDQDDSRFLFSMPVLVHPSPYWGIEFRPAWADRVRDIDIAVTLSYWRYNALKLGYRRVSTPGVSLEGPYIGFAVYL